MKVQSRIKQILRWSLATIIVLILLTEFSTQVLFKKAIENEVQLVLNDRLESKATFEDISISVFKRFPNLTVTFESIEVKEGGYKVLDAGLLELQFSPLEFVSRNYAFKKVLIQNTTYWVQVDSNGQKFEIKGKPTPPTPTRDLSLNIPEIVVKNSQLRVNNRYKKNWQVFTFHDALLSLDSHPDIKTLHANVNGRIDSLVAKGIFIPTGYSLRAENAVFRFNTLEGRMIFNGQLILDKARLQADGSMYPAGNGQIADITLQSIDDNFDDYLNLLTGYRDLQMTQTNPEAKFNVKIHSGGFINPMVFPSVKVDFEILDAAFIKEGMEDPLENVHLLCTYSNGEDRTLETTKLVVEKGNATLKENFLTFQGSYENFADPFLDLTVNSKVDLLELKPILDFENGRELSGLLELEVYLKGKLSELEKTTKNKEKIYEGSVKLTDVYAEFPKEQHSFKKVNALVSLKETNLILDHLKGNYNNTNFIISGNVKNLINSLNTLPGEKSLANLNVSFDKFIIPDSLLSNTSGGSMPENVELNVVLKAGEIKMDKYEIRNLEMNAFLNKNHFDFKKLKLQFDETNLDLVASRKIINEKENISIQGKIGLVNLDKYISEESSDQKSNESQNDFSNMVLHADITAEGLIYKSENFKNFQLYADVANSQINLENLRFDFPYGRFDAKVKTIGIDNLESINGSVRLDLTALEVNEFKKFFLKIVPPDSTSESNPSEDIDVKLKVEVNSPSIGYDSLYIEKVKGVFDINNEFIVLSGLDFEIFDGQFNVRGFVDDRSKNELGAIINLKASEIQLGKLVTHLEKTQKELFSEDSFRGTMDIVGELLVVYDKKSLEHQEDQLLGKVKLVLNQGELIDFAPISESLKFIKKDVREDILLDNQNFEILFHNDEIVIPQTRFSSNLSNIEFVGYHNKNFDFGFDLRLSAGDLLFKSQKKKEENVKNQSTKLGAFNTFLSARTETGELKIKAIKKKDYNHHVSLLNERYILVDSALNQAKSQILNKAVNP